MTIQPQQTASQPPIKVPVRQNHSAGKQVFSRRKLFTLNNRLFSILVGLMFAGIFSAGVYVLATTYGVDALYPAGNTLDPTNCNPGDAYCKVAAPLTDSFATNFSGTGNFTTTGTITSGNQLKILEGTGTTYYTIFQGGDQSADLTYTLPTALPGGAAFLKSSSGGVMSWDTSTYLTTEADTLALVTGRGASTSNAVTLSNATTALTIGSGASSTDYRILFDGATNNGTLTWLNNAARFSFNGGVEANKGSSIAFDNVLLSSLQGGMYFGRVGVTQNQLALDDSLIGATWTAKDSSRTWYGVAMSSDGKYQTAVDGAPGYIYISSDYGATWTAKDSSRGWLGIAMSSDGKYQTATVVGGYIYISSDYGATWTAKDSSRSWYGVAMSSDGKYQTAVDQGSYIYISSDYGATWTAKDSGRGWFFVAISSDGKYQTATTGNGAVDYIYISSDYGNNWTAAGPSRDWYSVAMSSDGKYQTAVVEGSGYIYISSDYGATWTAKDSSRTWFGNAMSSDGKYQTAVVNGGYIYISSDYGATWTAKDSSRGWIGVAMSSDGKYQTALVQNGYIYVSYNASITNGNLAINYGTLGIQETGASPTYHTYFQGGNQAADLTYTLPTAYPASSGYVLSSTTGGVMSWAAGGGSQTPWTSNIDAAGFNLTGAGTITAGTKIGVLESSSALATSEVAHWLMNDNAASTTVVDDKAAHNGTAQQNTSVITAGGKINTSLSFNGSSDWISVADHADFDFGSGDFTVAWWEYKTASAGIAIARNNITYSPFLLGYGGGEEVYMSSNGSISGWDIASSKTLGAPVMNGWSHLVVTRIGTAFKTYRDNVQQDSWTSSASFPAGGAALQLGKGQGSTYFSGRLDDIRIWKGRGLSTSEISTVYNSGTGREDDPGDVVGTYYSYFQSGDQTADITYTLPTAVSAANSLPLVSSTAGVLSWSGDFGANNLTTTGTGTFGNIILTPGSAPGSPTNGQMYCGTNCTNLYLYQAGVWQTVTTSSSLRYKHDIQPLADDWTKILQIQPKSFLYNDQPNNTLQIGYIAEDLDVLGLKDLVKYDGEGLPSGINYDKIVMYNTEIIKQQQIDINALKQRLGISIDNSIVINPAGTVSNGEISGVNLSSFDQSIKSSLANLGATLSQGIISLKQVFVDNLTAKIARMDKIEMVDSETGDIYCTWVANGDWQKTKGECDSVTVAITPTTPGVNETPTPGVETTQIAINIAQQAAEAAQEAAQQAQQAQQQASRAQRAATQAQDTAQQIQEQVQSQPQAVNITSVASIADINVDYGTDLAFASLPTTVNVILSDNTNQTVTVAWDEGTPVYDLNTAGIYVFSGELTFSGNITNTDNLTASVNVIVDPQPLPAAGAASDLIQDAASSLLNGVWNFVKYIFNSGTKAVSSMQIIQKASASLTQAMTIFQSWMLSLEIKSLVAGLFEPVLKLFSR